MLSWMVKVNQGVALRNARWFSQPLFRAGTIASIPPWRIYFAFSMTKAVNRAIDLE